METTAYETQTAVVADAGVATRDRVRRKTSRRSVSWGLACLATDVGMLLLALGTAALGGSIAHEPTPGVAWILGFVGLCLVLSWWRGLYRLPLRLLLFEDVVRVLSTVALVTMAIISARALLGSSGDSALAAVWLATFACAFVIAGRAALYSARQRSWAVGDSSRRTLIVGAGRVGSTIARRLVAAPELGLKPVAFLDSEPLYDTPRELGIPVVGAERDIDEVTARYGIEHVIVSFSAAPDDVQLRIVRWCEARGIAVSIVPRLFERMSERHGIDHFGGIALLTPQRASPHARTLMIKSAIDRSAAALALIVLAPVFLAISIAVLVSTGRPIFFRQVRVGRGGTLFEMLKFRSMTSTDEASLRMHLVGGDALGPGGVESADDSRATPIGVLLRRLSLDELPQLINVVKGDMSLIGPRPERPEYVSEFSKIVYRYDDRHRVKPGITGWAQVHGLRGRTSLRDRAEWDNFYIENLSLTLDLKIAVKTVGAILAAF